jgi:hypothetical protein
MNKKDLIWQREGGPSTHDLSKRPGSRVFTTATPGLKRLMKRSTTRTIEKLLGISFGGRRQRSSWPVFMMTMILSSLTRFMRKIVCIMSIARVIAAYRFRVRFNAKTIYSSQPAHEDWGSDLEKEISESDFQSVFLREDLWRLKKEPSKQLSKSSCSSAPMQGISLIKSNAMRRS